MTQLADAIETYMFVISNLSDIIILGKGRKEREVGLGARARVDLHHYIRQYRKHARPEDVVFLSRYSEPLTRNGLDQLLYRLKEWGDDYALCMMRVTVGMHAPSLAQTLVGAILGTLPLLLMAFLAVLVLARGRKARSHLLLVLPVTIGMLALCLACAGWLVALWPLLPQISQFYPQATAELLAGLVGMGLATLLALGSLARDFPADRSPALYHCHIHSPCPDCEDTQKQSTAGERDRASAQQPVSQGVDHC